MSQLLAAASAPAGGAAMGQVIGVTVAVSIGFTALIVLGSMHRAGRHTPLGALAAFSERISGLPAWAALPLAIAGIALVTAVVGYMWDVAWHIERGRDDGPLANPSHYLILAGLYGIVAAGYLTTVLPRHGEMPGRSALRLAPGWNVPLGGALIMAAGLFAFAGFPLDDFWHRLFGQDVTLWGPTHLIMLGGGMMTLIGITLLFDEGVRCSARRDGAARDPRRRPARTPLARLAEALPAVPLWPSRALIAGGILAGLSIFQGEFDYGVPQFELVLQPLLIAVAAGISLVFARVWIGRGGALAAVAFYLVIRGALAIAVGPIFGFTTPAMPLYVPEAICVEVAALAFGRRHLAVGAVGGVALGTLGFAGEWAWVNQVMPLDWSSALMPEGLILAAAGGTAAGIIGALFGMGLRRSLPSPRLAGGLAAGSLIAVIGCFAFGLADRTPSGATAQVTLTEASPPPERRVNATVRFDPPDLAEGAGWVRGIAWQGGGLVGFQMERLAEGVYRTPSPLPAYGDWKSGFRIQNGHSVIGVQLYAPADAAIPLPAVPPAASFIRPLKPDREILQRERKPDVPGWLWMTASLIVFALSMSFLGVLAWGVGRHARGPRQASPAHGRDLGAIATGGAR